MTEADEEKKYTDRVRIDHHLHWTAIFGVGAYAWQLHSFFVGVVSVVGVLLAITLTNIALMALGADLKSIRWARWAWVVIAFVALVISGAQIVQPT